MFGDGKFKILIVDDERANIIALSHILRPMYTVLAAKDGSVAIEVAQNNKPDLILLDIIMPNMSGFEVLAELKNSDLTINIPVIFITSLDGLQHEEKGLLLGAVDYITKPFYSSIVKLKVKAHLKIVEQMRTIERLGMIDTLTNIPNRRCYDHQLNVEWARAVRKEIPIGILMIDIDNFKIFNDTYGHTCGDEALKAVAEVISRTLKRPADFAARWGGEEFVVLLPDTDLHGVLNIAGQIRSNIENTVISLPDGRSSSITVSIGAYHEVPTINSSVEVFVAEADKALYSAKAAGKNIVMPCVNL